MQDDKLMETYVALLSRRYQEAMNANLVLEARLMEAQRELEELRASIQNEKQVEE